MSSNDFLSKSAAAKSIGVTRRMVYHLIDAGLLPLDEHGRVRKRDLEQVLGHDDQSNNHSEQFCFA
jgi:hypothetical protein